MGGVDRVFSHSPKAIDNEFRRANAATLGMTRGAGYWLWKPYLITRHLAELGANDWLFYCDSGAFLLASPALLVEHAAAHGEDVLIFKLEPHAYHLECFWTKRDAFVLLGCDSPRFWRTVQRHATCSLWRGTRTARDLAADWLDAARDPRALTDAPNECGLPNLVGFRDHRHDQSLLSLLTKRNDLRSWRDPTQFGNAGIDHRPDCAYPQIVHSTRSRTPALEEVARGFGVRVVRRLRASAPWQRVRKEAHDI